MRLMLRALILLFATHATAHEFWIEPASPRQDPGALQRFALRVGEAFRGEPVARSAGMLKRFELIGPDGAAQPILGTEGMEPAGLARPAAPGLWLAVLESPGAYVELPPAKFEAYLRDEGLESIVVERETRGERAKNGREKFRRCAKALITVGTPPADDAGATRVVGLPLELVPDRTPGRGALEFTVLCEGRPLARALVTAAAKDDPSLAVSRRTDAAGRVRFDIARGGPWLVTTVHMVRAQDAAADWISFWASFRFDASDL